MKQIKDGKRSEPLARISKVQSQKVFDDQNGHSSQQFNINTGKRIQGGKESS